MQWDVIVVGAGGIGSQAMLALADRGLRVLGLDRFAPPHGRGSSHGDTRIIRLAYMEHPDYVPLLRRAYAGWAYSADFYRNRLYQALGFGTLEEFLVSWEDDHLACDANDLLASLWTWQHGDASANDMYRGNFDRALSSIRAKTIVMPCDQDMYFTLEESLREMALIPDAELRPFRSAFGHCAGAPGRFPEEMSYLDSALRDLLDR
jgi:glycine/D-amino acid oxidase-like deaminating enzyme